MLNSLKNSLESAVAWLDGQPAGRFNTFERVEPTLASANDEKEAETNLKIPVLIPESPLINFLSQLSLGQRLGIRNITLSEELGYHTEQRFPDAEALYKWLTPGKRITFGFEWPAEKKRVKWFRRSLEASDIEQAAEIVHDLDVIKQVTGRPQF